MDIYNPVSNTWSIGRPFVTARRNFPAEAATSSLSVYLASGTLSARTAVRAARDRNRTKKLDGGDEGIRTWISEVAWRDFYRHVLVNWPYVWYGPPHGRPLCSMPLEARRLTGPSA